jgi:hypothetical protein
MVENNASARLVPFRILAIRGFAFLPILGILMPILGMFKGAELPVRDTRSLAPAILPYARDRVVSRAA